MSDKDTIYRQDAINAVKDRYYKYGRFAKKEELVWSIEKLPSAQPEIIHCKDCKYAYITADGECKYCDIWFPDEKLYMPSDYFCGSAERRVKQNETD